MRKETNWNKGPQYVVLSSRESLSWINERYGLVGSNRTTDQLDGYAGPGHVEKAVNTLMRRGWRPLGGLAVFVTPAGKTTYLQAMFLEEGAEKRVKKDD